MEGGCGMSRVSSRQDGSQFEDSLRRLHALEKKLTDQVQFDIAELRQKWIQLRVDRVTHNTFKLYQVREHLKHSKVLYVEEEQILTEFTRVKEALLTNSLDDETFEATRETCLVLGGKLGNIRQRQTRCYSDTSDLELVINKDIVALKFEDKDFEDLDIEQVRASTPVRQLSPTPLDRHRSRSREPSEFRMPAMKLSTGTTTPGGSLPQDPHAYFSRPGSSQSMYAGKQDMDVFRTAMEAKQAEDVSPDTERKVINQNYLITDKIQVHSAIGQIIGKTEESDLALPGGVFESERPGSAMSDMSIDMEMVSRPGSKLEYIGDEVSGKVAPLLENLIEQQNGEFIPTAKKTDNLECEPVKSETTAKDSILSNELSQEKFTGKDGEVVKDIKHQQIVKDDSKNKDGKWGKKKKEEKDNNTEEENQIKSEARVERILNSSPIEKENNAASLRKQDDQSKSKDTEINKDTENIKQDNIKFENLADSKEVEENKVEQNYAMDTNKGKKDSKLIKGEAKKKRKPEKKKDEKQNIAKKTEVIVEEKGQVNQEPKTEQSLLVTEEETKSKEESIISSSTIKQISESGSMKVVDNKVDISLSAQDQDHVEIAFKKSEDCQPSRIMSLPSTITTVQRSRDSSKDRNSDKNTKNEEITFKPPSKSLSKSGSLQKSNSFNKDKKRISFVDDIDIEKFQVDAEPISLAKEIFAEIADASIEAGLTRTKHEFSPIFIQNEPAEWYPPEGSEFENEDELMLILDEEDPDLVALRNEKSKSRSKNRSACINSEFTVGLSETGLQQSMSTSGVPELETVEVKSPMKKTIGDFNGLNRQSYESDMDSQSNHRSMSTGFSHLDEFERRLAEMEQELENEEALRSQCDPIGEGLLRRSENNWDLSPPPSRANTDNDNNWEETFENFQKTENMLTKISSSENQDEAPFGEKKPAPLYESENDVQCEYIFDEITGQSIKRYKKVSFAAGEERHTIQNSGELTETVDNQETQQPVAPRRSTSKEPTPTAFLSAMTGGLIEHTVFGSLVQKVRKTSRSRSRSRQGSRQSSGDRSSQDLGSEDEGSRSLDFCDSASDVGSESSLVTKLKKITKKKSKVQAADFDALFARGMAMSTGLGSADGKEHLLADKEELFKSSFKPNGIENNKKVLSYLDDQGQPQTSQLTEGEENHHGHISRERGRKKQSQQPINQRPVSIDSKARSMSTEQRKRSREYAKPEEIKVSPAPKRDLFTGLLVPDTPEAMFLQRVTDFVAKNQKGYIEKAIQIPKNEDATDEILNHTQNTPERISPLPLPRSPPTLAPSPGKTILDAKTGQEIFGASIEEDLIESKSEPKFDISDAPVVLDKNIQYPTSIVSSCLPRMDEPADKGIPAQLIPDKLMANEEFYENLRVGIKSAEEPIQLDTESFQKYSRHLGRAEFGTLKKKSSTAASRDTSADRFKTKVVSRDPSADTRFNSNSKLSRQSSKDQVRSDSRMSDYSTALPDLEMDGEIATNDMQVAPASNIQMKRTQSLMLGSEQEENPVIIDSTAEVLAIREEVLKEMEERKQQIKDTKAWIQNGLMTVVGFGVMAYLQTLEAVAGGQ